MKSRIKTPVTALIMLGSVLLTMTMAIADGDTAMTDGTIRKVDTDQGKVTIKHGPITNLGMPPMTMVFTLKDSSQLDGVSDGDTVRFHVIDEGGKMVIEVLEKVE